MFFFWFELHRVEQSYRTRSPLEHFESHRKIENHRFQASKTETNTHSLFFYNFENNLSNFQLHKNGQRKWMDEWMVNFFNERIRIKWFLLFFFIAFLNFVWTHLNFLNCNLVAFSFCLIVHPRNMSMYWANFYSNRLVIRLHMQKRRRWIEITNELLH